ncbi:VOC family protein [filamentous cyanobacterium LEGE 11480]|uniref:VOC family protein n=1 Tax=Romeriopsis navalis LEGE 11480 TaxID=2777977 RepID=A0A928VQW7_9CYAN|nr:VOC family protein [Romeriopsis navalis]MBE9033103.1 VOC family protein [Romeriopsis navalis LEGE 11480]
MHHASIRTADIHQAIGFYEQLGFVMEEQFTAGYTLACWMTGLNGRIELLQVPEPQAPPDPFGDEHYVGYYHLSFDLTGEIADLSDWLSALQLKLQNELKILLEPTQQMIGQRVYEVAFIADRDGMPIEFLRQMNSVS